MLDAGLYVSYALFFIASGAAIIFPVLAVIKSPKSAGKSGLGVVALLVLFGIAYGLSGSELSPKWQVLGVTTEFYSKLIGAGLTLFYFTLLLAILTMIYSEINKALK